MSLRTFGGLRTSLLGCVIALLATPAAAQAASGPGLTIGPIKASHGWVVTISTTCSGSASATTVDYIRGGSKADVDHGYSGPKSSCSLSRSLRSGSLSVSWPGLAKIHVKLARSGSLRRPAALPGCRQSGAGERALRASGRISLAIHKGVFGKVSTRHVSAFADKEGSLKCSGANHSIAVNAPFGTSFAIFLSGTQPRHGDRIVSVTDSTGDQPGGGVTGFMYVELVGGRSLFDARSNLGGAVFHAKGLISGTMKFHAKPACTGQKNSRPGTLSGRLVLHDPVLGTIRLAGSQTTGAYIVKGNASEPSCGTQIPPTPSYFDGCNTDGLCSISAGTNTDTFYDATSPGTYTVTGETWSFGDGTSAPGTLDGSVQHTYAAPGTYTVTLTVYVSGGGQYTTTGTVYIDP
ncbi:MAG: PKD domain-containing protein [Solirubrobacteraceae bacterium]